MSVPGDYVQALVGEQAVIVRGFLILLCWSRTRELFFCCCGVRAAGAVWSGAMQSHHDWGPRLISVIESKPAAELDGGETGARRHARLVFMMPR